MRIGFVHDYLTQYGGAERLLEVLYTTFADNPRHIYTSIFAPDQLPPRMRDWPVTSSPISRLPLASRTHRAWLAAYPWIFRQLGASITDADIAIADTSAWAHHARPAAGIPFLVYCHSPARFLYGDEHYLEAVSVPTPIQRAASPLFAHLRDLDVAAAQHPDRIISNSNAVRARVRELWGRDSDVIHPPIATARFRPDVAPGIEPWFLVVSRLVPHKWIDRAIEASNRANLPLRVIGTGRAERSLRAIAGPQVEFLGQLPDREVVAAMQRCRALILPGVEDFGMTAVEAQAAGRPVIAAADGGALETVVDGRTGLLVPVGEVEALAEAMHAALERPWDSQAITDHADTFDARHFQRSIRTVVTELTRRDIPPGSPCGLTHEGEAKPRQNA